MEKTIEDIVKEMRGHGGHCLFDERDLASLADRIEEALKRKEALKGKEVSDGND